MTSTDPRVALTSGSDTWHSTPLEADDATGRPAIRRLTLSDGPHGLRRQPEHGDALGIGGSVPATCFPPAAALAASWDPELVSRVGAALGAEARALGVDVLLGPGMNIRRSPLGGRNFEYVSEDPHVTGRFAAAFVRGVQSTGVAATPKHFAVNNQETDRWRVSADVDERALREIYLPAFEHVVREARPWALMCAYNKVNGTYASEHTWLLTTVLRDEWGFDGLVMSDWGAVNDRVAAVAAGLDLEMPPTGTDDEIAAALDAGALDPAVLDRVTERLALLAARTAPSDAPGTISATSGTTTIGGALPDALVDAHDELAREAARASTVLLRNDGTLPLDPARTPHVAVVGELARTPRYQGGGSSRVNPTRVHAPLDALRDALTAAGGTVTFAPGYPDPEARGTSTGTSTSTETRTENQDADALRDEAVAVARAADVTVVFLGLPAAAESEGYDRTDLALPADQLAVLDAVAAAAHGSGGRVVVVLAHGGVVDLRPVDAVADAVLDTALPGQAGGLATTDVLLGAEPGGRLTDTVPLDLADTPTALTFPGRDGRTHHGEGVFVGYRAYDTLERPVAYPFGHGLSYGTATWSDLEVAEHRDGNEDGDEGEGWTVTFTVTNDGTRPTTQVPQLYVAPPATSGLRPSHELRGSAVVHLEPGESRQVTLPLGPRDLATWDEEHHRWRVDAGTYGVEVAASSRDVRLTGALTSAGDGYVPPLTATSTVAEWAAHPVGRGLVEAMRAAVPADALAAAPEATAMVAQVPMVKLATFGLGITREIIDRYVAAAAD